MVSLLKLAELRVEFFVEFLPEVPWQIEFGSIGNEFDDISRAIQDGGAVLAHFEVRFHASP